MTRIGRGRCSLRVAWAVHRTPDRRTLTRRWGKRGVDDGSALVETIFVIAAILIPMVWIALAVTRVEAASYAVRAAAREAARTYVTASSSASGAARAQVAARLAFEDQRAPVGTAQISCSATPCLSPGASVHARAVTRVDLPFVPHWLASGTGLQIRVDAQHTETVERYGGTR